MPITRARVLSTGVLLGLGLLVLGWVVGGVGFGACDENIAPGTTRAAICSSAGSHTSRYALILVPPLLVLAVAFFVSRVRLLTAFATLLALGDLLVLGVFLLGAT
jgi:hypothetical protein